jgi:hypothetical protein
MATQRIDVHRSLLDQQLTRLVQHQRGLLLRTLDRNKAHPGTRHRFADRLGVDCIVLVGLTLESISSTIPLGGRQPWTVSLHGRKDRRAPKGSFPPSANASRSGPFGSAMPLPQSRLAANNPTHRGIMTQAFCVIHILVSGKSPEHTVATFRREHAGRSCRCVRRRVYRRPSW